MKKLVIFLVLFWPGLYCLETEYQAWNPAQEVRDYKTAKENADKLATQVQKLVEDRIFEEDRLQRLKKERLLSEEDNEKLEKINVELAQAKYDLATAQKSMIESDWNQAQKDLSLTDRSSGLDKIETEQRQAQTDILKNISDKTEKLSKSITIVTSPEKEFKSGMDQINQYLELRVVWPDKAYTIDNQILSLLRDLNKTINRGSLEKELRSKKTNKEQIDAIHNYNEQLMDLRKLVEDELGHTKKGETKQEIYRKMLAEIKQKEYDSVILSSEPYLEKPVDRGWFGRIIDRIASWLGYKTIIQEPIKLKAPETIIENERRLIEKNKAQFVEVRQLLTDIGLLEKKIEVLNAKVIAASNARNINLLNTLKNDLNTLQELHRNYLEQIGPDKAKAYGKIDDIYRGIVRIYDNLAAIKERQRTSYKSLFDSIIIRKPFFKGRDNKNFYEVLGVRPYASIEEVASAYNKLNDNLKEELSEIYQVLSNPLWKVIYDAFLKDYRSLMMMGLDRDQIEDVSLRKPEYTDFLNKKGELAKIEITQDEAKTATQILSQYKLENFKDFTPQALGSRLGQVQTQLEDISKQIEEALKPAEQRPKTIREQAQELRKELPVAIQQALQAANLPNFETDDYYEVLGVKTDANLDDLMTAYQQYMFNLDTALNKILPTMNTFSETEKKAHTAKVKEWIELTRKFITNAYAVLLNDETREKYDEQRKKSDFFRMTYDKTR